MSRVYCLDPGPTLTGWLVLDTVSRTEPIIEAVDGIDNEVLLYRMMNGEFDVSCPLVVEYMHSSNAQPIADEHCRTIMMTGRFVQAWMQSGGDMPIAFVRKQIASHITGAFKTSDALVNAAIRNHYDEPLSPKRCKGPLKCLTGHKHTWAALALGLAYSRGFRSYSKGRLVTFGCLEDDPEDQRSLMNGSMIT